MACRVLQTLAIDINNWLQPDCDILLEMSYDNISLKRREYPTIHLLSE